MKERIITEARHLFNHYGVKTIRLDDIANQLGMSKKTVYLYFESKEDLVRQMLESQLNESLHEAHTIQAKETNPIGSALLIWDRLIQYKQTINPSLLLDIERQYATVWQLFQTFRSHYMNTILVANLQAGMAQGLYRSDLSVGVMAWLWVEQSQADVPTKGDEQAIKHHFVRGLLTQTGLAIYEAAAN